MIELKDGSIMYVQTTIDSLANVRIENVVNRNRPWGLYVNR